MLTIQRKPKKIERKIVKRAESQTPRQKRQALIREIGIVAVAKQSSICYQTASSFTMGKPVRPGIEIELIQGGLKACFGKLDELEKQRIRILEQIRELNVWKSECIVN